MTPGNTPAKGGALITLTGRNFGIAPVLFVNSTIVTTQNRTHQSLVFRAPAGTGTRTIKVSVSNRTSNVLVLTYDGPIFISTSPAALPTQGPRLLLFRVV